MFLVLVQFSISWWDEPHQMIANIAKRSLSQDRVDWINKLMNLWLGEEGDIVSVSTWQDSVKASHFGNMGAWHFYDNPYGIHGYKYNQNLYFGFFNVNSTLSDTIQAIYDKTTTSPWALAFHIRSLIHFVGDSHTPLHSVAGYSSAFPKGDAGGNFIKNLGNMVKEWGGQPSQNLHKVWDSCVYHYQASNAYKYENKVFEENTTSVINYGNGLTIPDKDETTPMKWLLHAYDIASMTYENMTNSGSVYNFNLANIKNLGEVEGRKQIYLAGHRLGLLLNKFFEVRGFPDISLPDVKPPVTQAPAPVVTSEPDPNQDTGSGSGKLPFGLGIREMIVWAADILLLIVNITYFILVMKDGHHIENKEQLEEQLNNEIEAI